MNTKTNELKMILAGLYCSFCRGETVTADERKIKGQRLSEAFDALDAIGRAINENRTI